MRNPPQNYKASPAILWDHRVLTDTRECALH